MSINFAQKQATENKKELNDLKQTRHKLELQMHSKDQDIEEAYQTLESKDIHLKDIKETLNRQNAQIEEMRG